MKNILTFLLLLACSYAALAHHSFSGRFDTANTMILEGEVTRVLWRNPHAHIMLVVTDNGESTEWDLESGSPTLMTRAGIPRDAIREGMHIKVAAYPPLTGRQEAFATNILLPDGEELLLQTGASPQFNEEVTGDFSYRFRTAGDRSRPDLGLFRIWTFSGAVGGSAFLFPESINPGYDLNVYPMTDAARAAVAAFNAATDNPTNNCTPKGMPTLMEQPLPMQIVDDGDAIILNIEEYDLVRTIHMNMETAPEGTPSSPLGFSSGHWEGDTLVATTTHIDWPHFNQAGIPQSEQSVITEYFTAVEAGSQLDYKLVVNDPVNFTEPVTLTKTLLYIPEVELIPFECTVE